MPGGRPKGSKTKKPVQSQLLVESRLVEYAEDVKLGFLRDYLCSAGPGLCRKCRGCAFGRRYVREVLDSDVPQVLQKKQDHQREKYG